MLKNDLSKIREMQRVGFIQYIKKKQGGGRLGHVSKCYFCASGLV